jgi:hypothetical protein
LSNRALTSHQIASNLTTGGVCTAFALDVNGAQFISLDDFTTDGLAERLTFTTTVAGRPRRVGAGVAPR